MKESINKRTIAIVGRPNVGKSALFNRLAGRRISIVHAQSGVTRDRVSCHTSWCEKPFELIDTGGLATIDGSLENDTIIDGTHNQVHTAIENAAAILFVVDITSDITPLDQEVAKLLHKSNRPVLLAANKADNPDRNQDRFTYASLGFPVFAISALHNSGVADLMDATMKYIPKTSTEPIKNPLRVAIAGRPNAGKSAYINRLMKSNRVIVSETPGTTRDSVEIPFTLGKGPQARHYALIDTAGFQRRKRDHEAVDKYSQMRTEQSLKDADLVAIVVDASEGPCLQDKKIAASVLENQKGCLFLINKWDLATDAEVTQTEYEQAVRQALPFMNFAPLVFISAQSGYNIRRSLDAIDYVANQTQTRITTGVLNRVLEQATTRLPAPRSGNGRLKIYYATQVTTQPIRFKLFVNNNKRVVPSYKKYLISRLRDAFGLEGAPIELLFTNR